MKLRKLFLLSIILFQIFSCATNTLDDTSESSLPVGNEKSIATESRAESTAEEEPIMLFEEESDGDSLGSSRPTISGLKAGYSDDNKQFGYFIRFLKEYNIANHLPLPVQERIIIKVVDVDNKSIPNTQVKVFSGSQLLVRGKTLADGTYQFNPSEYSSSLLEYNIECIFSGGEVLTQSLNRDGSRTVDIQFDSSRIITENIPLDIVFIMDTTGSMGEEIQRLKTTIELIHLNLENLPIHPVLRFGMVLYKDVEDEYRTRLIPLTSDLELFQKQLNLVEASGGGDSPEDLQAALDDTIHSIDWNKSDNGVRLAFIVTDAPPHLDYKDQTYTYISAAKDAREMALKIYGIGTGGLPLDGEYILRQIAQYTGGKYIFLTYGEGGESEGSIPGSVSHHTGANWQTGKLESIIVRFAKEELSHLSDSVLEEDDPYFEARKIAMEEKEDTLRTLFDRAMTQLADFSTYSLKPDTGVAILPILDSTGANKLTAEYFTEQFIMAAADNSSFTLVERKDLNSIFDEMNLQLSGITDGEGVVEIGKILNADVLISGKLYKKETQYELFLKLLRVETGEVLSITKARLDHDLGL